MKSPNALISVIIPTFNRIDLLERSIKSVLEQEYDNIEILIVNDGGESPEKLLQSLSSSRSIRYINLIKNSGVSASRNTGLKLAQGEWIALLDDDDYYKENHISSLFKAAINTKNKFLYSLSEYKTIIKDNTTLSSKPFANVIYNRDLLMVANFIPTPTWFFSKDLIAQAGYFDTELKAWEDWEWLLRASEHTEFECTNVTSVIVNQRPDDHTHLGIQHRPEMAEWFRRIYLKHPAPNQSIKICREEFLNSISTGKENFKSDKVNDVYKLIDIASQKSDLEAINIYNAWLKNSHRNFNFDCFIHYNLGCLYFSLNKIDEAKKCFEVAFQLNPNFKNNQSALHALANV